MNESTQAVVDKNSYGRTIYHVSYHVFIRVYYSDKSLCNHDPVVFENLYDIPRHVEAAEEEAKSRFPGLKYKIVLRTISDTEMAPNG
jgi:hypothetical protein